MANSKKLDQAVGRLLVGRLPGLEMTSSMEKALRAGTAGGIVIFKENASTLAQMSSLGKSIYEASHHPPIVAVDQEGGAVQRFDHVLTPLPSAMALAAGRRGPVEFSASLVRRIMSINATQLKALGFNCLLAPVLDVLTNPLNPVIATRAFGSTPSLVSKLSQAAIEAISEAGVVAVGKHFPGHGATLEDSHTALAVNPYDADALWHTDLVPFKECAPMLPAILTGHIWLPAIEPEPMPASLSRAITTKILREYFGFDGLIMTDDMMMKAVSDRWGLQESAIMAVEAGADVILVCGDGDVVLSVQQALVKAVQSGRLTEERIEQSNKRIDKLFSEKSFDHPNLDELANYVADSTQITLDASLRGVALIRGQQASVTEIDAGAWVVVAPRHARYPMNLSKYLSESLAERALTEESLPQISIEEVRYSIDPDPREAEQIASECAGKNCILITYRTALNHGQALLARLLKERTVNHIALASDVPFDTIALSDWSPYLATFDPSELAMRAAAQVIAGQHAAEGICPVSLEYKLKSMMGAPDTTQ